MYTTGQMLRRYLVASVPGFALTAWIWLPSGATQIGELPLRLRLTGLLIVVGGPIGAIYWEALYGRLSDALPWAIMFGVSMTGMILGVRIRKLRLMRVVGYFSVVLWLLVGLVWSVAGL